jgi:hypothetical protein
MGESYAKLFSTIATSTIWSEPLATRVVWITMLAIADRSGEVQASVPGLARVSNVSLAECEAAIETLLAPDRYSRTPEHEGRRIEKIDGGWRLLNHGKYRAKLDAEDRRARKAKWIAEKRARNKQAKPPGPEDDTPEQSTDVDEQVDMSTESTHAASDADAPTDASKSNTRPTHHASDDAREDVCVDYPEGFEGQGNSPAPIIRPEAQAAIVLRKRGLLVNGSHPDLIAACAEGVTVQALSDLADAYPDKPAGYVIAAARRQHAERASPIPNSRAGPNGTPPLSKTGAAFHALDALATQLEANPHASDLHPAAQLVHRHDPARLEAPADLEPGSNARRRTAG